MGLGSLVVVSLKEARVDAETWREVAVGGRDPIRERARLSRQAAAVRPTLADVAHQAFEARKAQLKGEGEAGRWFSPLELHVLPRLGRTPIEDLDQNDIKSTLAPIWHHEGETAKKAITRLNVVFKHAVAMGLSVELQATEEVSAEDRPHCGTTLGGCS